MSFPLSEFTVVTFVSFFLVTFFYRNRRTYWFNANFRFSVDLHVLGCPEHDLTISGKCLFVCLSACVYGKNSVASVTAELMPKIS